MANSKVAEPSGKGVFQIYCNHCRINDLEWWSWSAKFKQYFHRHSQGKKVKWFVPAGKRPREWRTGIAELCDGKRHLK